MRIGILFFILGSVALTLVFTIEYSFAQSSLEGTVPFDNDLFIFVQTYVQNPNGELITYLASDKFTYLNKESLNSYLDNERLPTDLILTVNEKKFEVITKKFSVLYQAENVIASTILGHTYDGAPIIVARFAHDGYPVMPEDTVNSVWTFIRPID